MDGQRRSATWRTIICMFARALKRKQMKDQPRQVLITVGIGTFLSALAGSVVNLALPSIAREMSLSLVAAQWVVQAFLLANAVLLLPVGRLGDLVGYGRLYKIGFVLFGTSTLVSGMAQTFGVLIAARVVQGVSGAMVMATGPAIIMGAVPPARRGRALGVLATATYLGLTLGPPLGGFVIASLGWRWAFFLSTIASLVVIALAFCCLNQGEKATGERFDWSGALILIVGLPAVLSWLSRLDQRDLSQPLTWIGVVVALIGFAFFVAIEWKSANPLIDPRLFQSRIFTGAVLSAVANYIALFNISLLMPFFLEEGRGDSPDVAGLLLSMQPLTMAFFATPSGWLSDRIGSRLPTTAGMLVLAAGLFGASTLDGESLRVEILLWLAVIGLGTGVFISPNSSALMGSAPKERQGTAGAVLAEARIAGMLLGVAAASLIFRGAGGRTGSPWRLTDFAAFALVLRVGSVIALLGAAAAALRGGSRGEVRAPASSRSSRRN
jgi:EmrB/QacA subfamily drug resistance transporter